jgi:hypothetical protein
VSPEVQIKGDAQREKSRRQERDDPSGFSSDFHELNHPVAVSICTLFFAQYFAFFDQSKVRLANGHAKLLPAGITPWSVIHQLPARIGRFLRAKLNVFASLTPQFTFESVM